MTVRCIQNSRCAQRFSMDTSAHRMIRCVLNNAFNMHILVFWRFFLHLSKNEKKKMSNEWINFSYYYLVQFCLAFNNNNALYQIDEASFVHTKDVGIGSTLLTLNYSVMNGVWWLYSVDSFSLCNVESIHKPFVRTKHRLGQFSLGLE